MARALVDEEIKRYMLQIDLAERTLFSRKIALSRSSLSISKMRRLAVAGRV
jgi:hypothetical protein